MNAQQFRRHGLLPLVLVTGALMFSGCGRNEAAVGDGRGAEKPVAMRANVVTASGELEAIDSVQLGPPVLQNSRNQKITFMAPEGDMVKAGTPVMRFDASKQQQDMQVRRADLATAKQRRESVLQNDEAQAQQLNLQLAEARMKLDKVTRKLDASSNYVANNEIRKLRIDKQIADDEVARCEALLAHHVNARAARKALADAQVSRIQTDVDRLQDEIRRLTILAPKDGIVVHLSDWDGNKFAVGSQLFMGQTALAIPSLDRMRVKAEILEVDARQVQVGQRVDIVLDARPDKRFEGRVEKLGQAFRPRSHQEPTVVFDAEISLSEVDAELMRPGMAARLTIYSGDDLARSAAASPAAESQP